MSDLEQRRRNRKSALVLLILIVAIFGWTIFQGSTLFTGFANMTVR